MAARTDCETCLGKLLHGRRDAFAAGCDPGPNRDPRVDRTQPHTMTGHPDDGSRQRRGPLRGHHPLQSAQRGLAAHLPNTAKQKPLARHRWLIRKRRVHVVVGRWQRTAATPCLDATDACPRSGLEEFGKKGPRVAGPDTAAPVRNGGCSTPYTRDDRRFT